MKQILIALAAFLLLAILWELYCQQHAEMVLALPAPSGIMNCFWNRSERLLSNSWVTLKEMGGGFLVALAVAFPLAWTMYRSLSLRAILQPCFVLIQCLPMFAIAPLMVLWFGWSYVAIVVPTALMIFFPLTMNIYQGFCSTPRDLLDYFQLQQATPWQTFSKLEFPYALPQMVAGFRIAAGVAGIGAVTGEWAGGQAGLGLLMLESRRSLDLEMTFAALFCLTFISLAFYGGILGLERCLVKPWKILGLLIPLLALSGCSEKESSKNETRLLLDWLPNPNHVPLYLGVERGIFQKRGIDLKLLKIHDPSESLAFLSIGNVDLALYYMVETYVAKERGADLVTAGYLVRVPLNGFIYRKGEGIETPADLNGKKIGYCVGEFGLKLLHKALHQNQIIPAEFYNVSFDMVGTLAAKRIDILYGAYWNIEIEQFRFLGIETDYLPLDLFGIPPHEELLILANGGSRAATPAFLAAFKAALQESIDASVAQPDEAFKAYQRANRDKGEKTLSWEREAWRRTVPLLAKQQEDDPEIWNNFAKWVKR